MDKALLHPNYKTFFSLCFCFYLFFLSLQIRNFGFHFLWKTKTAFKSNKNRIRGILFIAQHRHDFGSHCCLFVCCIWKILFFFFWSLQKFNSIYHIYYNLFANSEHLYWSSAATRTPKHFARAITFFKFDCNLCYNLTCVKVKQNGRHYIQQNWILEF